MSDIFLSYASVDLLRIRPIIDALERHGWSVWWDRVILPGKTYDQVIEEALAASRCVIVVWSKASVASAWVRAEAEEGRQRNILVPVVIDDGVRIPLGFRPIQAARLVDWQGTEPHQEFAKVVMAVTHLLASLLPEEPAESVAEVPLEPQYDAHQPGAEASFTSELPRDNAVKASHGKRRFLLWSAIVPLLLVPILYWVFSTRDQGLAIKNSTGMEFVRIPAGEFRMGSNDGDTDERPVHTVRISRPFDLGKYEVTQAQWEAVMRINPSHFTGDPNRPVENVSWEDVQAFIRKLNAKEGDTPYRLPTEAEWEYAARAGTTTAFSFGNDAIQLGDYAWYYENSESRTHPVGQKKPNAWGLYDIHGNVWEWVQDWYGTYPAETITDPQGPSSGSGRVFRGGCWSHDAGYCRSAIRRGAAPGYRDVGIGFRLLRTVP
jgi:formylglycine-generating enzyme required for sulfatase activity